MGKPDTFRLYIRDVVYELLDLGRRAKESLKGRAPGTLDRAFEEGRAFAVYEVLSHMTNEARSFGIQLSDLGLDGIDADKEMTSFES